MTRSSRSDLGLSGIRLLQRNRMEITRLKRKLRELKRVEKRIRFGDDRAGGQDLVWCRFFSTEDRRNRTVKYSLNTLLSMDRQGVKQVIEEYFYHVFYQKYKESGIALDAIYDPVLLSGLGLPPGASFDTVRSRFRELAQKYHPDHGGDHEKMIELLETYHKLAGQA
jgi:hypothetical protein